MKTPMQLVQFGIKKKAKVNGHTWTRIQSCAHDSRESDLLTCKANSFALRGALFVFKPLPLRQIGCNCNKMLESRWDHRHLSLLIILFHFSITLTVTDWSHKWNSPTCDIASVLSCTTKHNLQAQHFFQIIW